MVLLLRAPADFSEEDTIGTLKKVSASISGRHMEPYLCKIARLRPGVGGC